METLAMTVMPHSGKSLSAFLALLLIGGVGLFGAGKVAAQSNPIAQDNELVQVKGLVVSKQKYQFTVADTSGQRVTVKLATGAPVALRLNRPFFDWTAGKVFVEPVPGSAPFDNLDDLVSTSAEGAKQRVPFRIPGKDLFLIARFRNPSHLERVMKAGVKRINFYLLTPDPLESHWPTDEELYIAGRLNAPSQTDDSSRLTVEVGKRSCAVQLGFRTATMNGYHIADLVPDQVRVILTGEREPDSGNVVASRVVFEPIISDK